MTLFIRIQGTHSVDLLIVISKGIFIFKVIVIVIVIANTTGVAVTNCGSIRYSNVNKI